MRTKFYTLLFVLVSYLMFSQEKLSYNNKGNTIFFTISEDEYYAISSENNRIASALPTQGEYQKITKNSGIIKVKGLIGNYKTRRQSLNSSRTLSSSERIEPVLVYKDGTKQMLNGQINIKVKPNSNIKTLISKWNFKIEENPFEKGLYLLSSDYTTEEIFSIVNELQNKKEIEFAEPNFIRLIAPLTNDPYFNSQWAIKNQGYNGGIPGA